MNLRFVERDGKKVLQYNVSTDQYGLPDTQNKFWVDVPFVEEKKESKKLWVRLLVDMKTYIDSDTEHAKIIAKSAIDAVIECYEEFDNLDAYDRRTFPEYLKEKLL